ncbi:hypothetical protein ACFO0M_15395 [Micromonospora mangrovi]|uniref:Uncharacterized protein n=2 Tax=Micromonospora TaxID=1873 RepID=A0AAU8HKR7_9ACTN
MKVKLRPGTQFVPAPRGVRCTRADDSFLLTGPPALFPLIDGCLGDLYDGTTVEELLATVAAPARPALDRVVAVLLERDALFTVDPTVAPPPDRETAARYADVLAYLEEHCAQPYAAFATLRQTTVTVLGDGPAASSARSGLAAAGIGTGGADADLVVAVDVAPPAGVPVLPVRARPDGVLVGPVLPDRGALPRLTAAMDRAQQWQRTLASGAAPLPVGAVLAGSLAARRVLDHLLGRAARTLTVVHGPAADTVEVPLASESPVDLTEPWRGWAVPLPEPAPVPPLRRVARQPVDGSPAVHGWGVTTAAAEADALLALARARCGTGLDAGRVAAAGFDEPRRLLDGGLRLIGADLLRREPGTPAGTDGLSPAARAVAAALRDYHERPVTLRLRRLPAGDWVLAGAYDRAGGLLAAEWAPGAAAALYATLMAALATVDAGAAAGPVVLPGTWTIAQSGDEAVSAALTHLHTLLGGRRLAGDPLVSDPVIGDLPLAYGPMWLE